MSDPTQPISALSLYHLVVTLHVLAALFWLGGMFFLAAVGAPVLRRVEPPELRRDLFTRLGRRSRAGGWIAIAVLVITGSWNLGMRGFLNLDTLGDGAFWQAPFGRALAWKLALVTMMLSVQAVHDFVHGPRVGRLATGGADAARARRRASWMARVNAVLGVLLVWVAVRLGRGG